MNSSKAVAGWYSTYPPAPPVIVGLPLIVTESFEYAPHLLLPPQAGSLLLPLTFPLPFACRAPLTHRAHGASLARAGMTWTLTKIMRCALGLPSAATFVGVQPTAVISRTLGSAAA